MLGFQVPNVVDDEQSNLEEQSKLEPTESCLRRGQTNGLKHCTL
jgi:hypothetical protein